MMYMQQNVHLDDQKLINQKLTTVTSYQTLHDNFFRSFLGKWREFRPCSSWVFGRWEGVNSGRVGMETTKIWKTTLTRKVGVSGMYKSFDKIP